MTRLVVRVHNPSRNPSIGLVALTVAPSPVGAHVGIAYKNDDSGELRHLHMAWHYQLTDESLTDKAIGWVEPSLSNLELSNLRASARVIAKKLTNAPYALKKANAAYGRNGNENGVLVLNDSIGLTCATFVLIVFEHAMVDLLELPTWDTCRSEVRETEDVAAQKLIVELLSRSRSSRAHSELVREDIGCTRVRAEEIVVASGMVGRPVIFYRVEPQGMKLTGLLRTTFR